MPSPRHRLMLHLHASTTNTDALIDRVADIRGPTRLVRHAPGLAHAGDHVAGLDYPFHDDPSASMAAAQSVVESLGPLVDRKRSVALIGTGVDFVAGRPSPIRYVYLMRRRHDFTHDEYLTRYHDEHARFGIETPGIEGYTQFHVDPDQSARAAGTIGFGVCDFDSVSELHLASLDTFFAALAVAGFGTDAVEDEKKFVDRDNSRDYVYEVLEEPTRT